MLGSVVGLEPRSAEKAIAGFLGSPILTPIFAAVVPAIAAGIIHLLITLIARPGKTSVETTSRIVAHADVTILL